MGCPPRVDGDVAVARKVGASMLAFWTAMGQSRMLLRISSGAKSRRVSQVPASRPITFSPARANGSAATPPAAPMPTITTSVPGRLVAMVASIVVVRAHRRFVEPLEVVCGLAIGFELPALHRLLICGGHHGADAGILQEIPPNEVGVAAVERIAKRALARVIEDHGKELCGTRASAGRAGFDVFQNEILIGRRPIYERFAVRVA